MAYQINPKECKRGQQQSLLGWRRAVWTVGGGKGGVGKSAVMVNLGVRMARLGKKVVMVDADLGGANLHTFFGLVSPAMGVNDFITRQIGSLQVAITPTDIPCLSIISGATNHLGAANLKSTQKERLIRGVKSLSADYILIDLGAGTAFHTLDLFLAGDEPIFVTIPEPTAIENTHRFLKGVLFRKFRHSLRHPASRRIVDVFMEKEWQGEKGKPTEIINEVRKIHPESAEILEGEMMRFHPKIIMNMVTSAEEAQEGESLQHALRLYYGITSEFLGCLERDDAVVQSIKLRRPAVLEFPRAPFSQGIDRIARTLLRLKHVSSLSLESRW